MKVKVDLLLGSLLALVFHEGNISCDMYLSALFVIS